MAHKHAPAPAPLALLDPDYLYKQGEIAAFLGKSPAWFERARWAGTGPAYLKIGRSVRYKGSQVMEWLDAQSRSSTSDKGAK